MNEHPDGHDPDTAAVSGGLVRTFPTIGEARDCGPFLTSPDTARTRPDTDTPDTRPDGTRFEYRATVPRHLAGAALGEPFPARCEQSAGHPDTRTAQGRVVRTSPAIGEDGGCGPLPTSADTSRTQPGHSVRRAQTRAAISRAFELPPDILRGDPR